MLRGLFSPVDADDPWIQGLEIDIHQKPYVLIVRLEGDADYLSTERLEASLSKVLVRRPFLVAFDLENLHSLSALALGALVRFQRHLQRFGGEVYVAHMQPHVWLALKSADVLERFPVCDALVAN